MQSAPLRSPLLVLPVLSVLSGLAAAQTQPVDAYWSDRWNSAYHRFTDADGDGRFDAQGEVTFLVEPTSAASAPAGPFRTTVEDGWPVAYWIVEFDDLIARGVDLNGDGSLGDEGEITVFRDSGALDGSSWPQAIDVADDGGVWWSSGLVIAQAVNGILRLEDLNADGDAADPGEQVLLVDGNGTPFAENDLGSAPLSGWTLQALAAAGDGVIAYASVDDQAVYRFEDLNADGDVADPGESVLLLNATGKRVDLPMNPDFADGTLKGLAVQAGWHARLIYLATTVEDGQRTFYFGTDSSEQNTAASTNLDGQGVNFLIFRGVDLNGDRDVNDAGEVKLFFDGSYTDGNPNLLTLRGLDATDDGALYAVGLKPYPVLQPGPNGNTWIHRFEDLNGDGDAMDPGEQQLDVFDLQVHGPSPVFPMPPFFGNVMADPWNFSVGPRLHFEPAFTLSGGGCSLPSGAAPTHSGTGSGLQGSPFTFRLDGALASSLALWTFGTSTTQWGGIPLPFDLAVLGFPGCFAYHDNKGNVLVSTDGAGSASLLLVLPTSATLAGVRIPIQWYVVGVGGELQVTGLGELLIK